MLGITNSIKKTFVETETDKGFPHQYYYMYAALFAAATPSSILEIGVLEGHSIRAWRKLFPQAKLTGIDCKRMLFDPVDNFEYIIADATDPTTSRSITKHDIIIDDSSHALLDQITIFQNFKDKFNYFYVIEDVNWERDNIYKPDMTEALKDCIRSMGFNGIAVYDSLGRHHTKCCAVVVHAKNL